MNQKSPSVKSLSFPKSPFFGRQKSERFNSNTNMMETPRPTVKREKELSVSKEEFLRKYENMKLDRYVSLNNEFKRLIEISMKLNENQQPCFTAMYNMSDIHNDGMSHIIQVADLKITISKSKFTNDKIEAVFIPFKHISSSIQYIVSTDPALESMVDFLQMIWENNIKYIITLTRVGKEKFHSPPYWPNGEGKIYFSGTNPSFEISKKDEIASGNLIKRVLLIKQSGYDHREVIQFHLTSNYRKNYSPYEMYNEILIKIQEIPRNNAILFHSGNSNHGQCAMLISINEIISKLFTENEINIFETVLQMNLYKNLMLQDERQYFDIYEFISCYLKEHPDLDMTLVAEKPLK